MRYYSIKHKPSGTFIRGMQWQKIKRGMTNNYKIVFQPGPNYEDINSINYKINTIIENKLQAILDECEIETYEKKYISIKSSIKMTTVRNRLEQKALVRKLKGF